MDNAQLAKEMVADFAPHFDSLHAGVIDLIAVAFGIGWVNGYNKGVIDGKEQPTAQPIGSSDFTGFTTGERVDV